MSDPIYVTDITIKVQPPKATLTPAELIEAVGSERRAAYSLQQANLGDETPCCNSREVWFALRLGLLLRPIEGGRWHLVKRYPAGPSVLVLSAVSYRQAVLALKAFAKQGAPGSSGSWS